MQACLMKKNIEVAVIEYDDGHISGVKEILNRKHMPVGTFMPTMTKAVCCSFLQAWQRSRAIPSNRTNLPAIVNGTGMEIYQLCALSHEMGLTDQYWVKRKGEDINWEEINFFQNGFEESSLTLLGKGEIRQTPDFETNGALPKAWILHDCVPTLVKASPDWLPTASANEVVASNLAGVCDITHVLYYPLSINGQMFCACPCFVDSDTEEFVSLLQFLRTHRISSRQAANEMGMDNYFLDQMTAFDLMLGNTDRHEGNMGMIFNSDTLEPISPAPLFDSGTCLRKCSGKYHVFKPFFRTSEEAVKKLPYVPFSLPDEEQACGIVRNVYQVFGLEQYTENAISELLHNIHLLKGITRKKNTDL